MPRLSQHGCPSSMKKLSFFSYSSSSTIFTCSVFLGTGGMWHHHCHAQGDPQHPGGGGGEGVWEPATSIPFLPHGTHAEGLVPSVGWQGPTRAHSVHPSIHPSVCPSFHLSIHPSRHPSVCPSVHPSVRPSIHLSICLSIHQSVHLSIHPSIPPGQGWGFITAINTLMKAPCHAAGGGGWGPDLMWG